MKKIVLSVSMCLALYTSKAQTNYTDSLLQKKTKMELTQIYLDEVKQIMGAIPYSPFTLRSDSMMSDTSTYQLDIPKTRYTSNKIENLSDETVDLNKIIQHSLYEIVPYSDKVDIIRAILYVQDINKHMKNLSK